MGPQRRRAPEVASPWHLPPPARGGLPHRPQRPHQHHQLTRPQRHPLPQHHLNISHQHQHQHQQQQRLRPLRPNMQWNAEEIPQFAPRMSPWQHSVVPSNVSNSNYQNVASHYNTFHPRLNWNPSHQHQRNQNASSWNYRVRPLLPFAHRSPSLTNAETDPVVENRTSEANKPFDKTLCDTIDTVKRKLRERKLSETHREKLSLVSESQSEEALVKLPEKKRIEHSKLSPKTVVSKKIDKREEKVKTSNTSGVGKPEYRKKSQVLRRKILQQLFKLNNNNLRQVLSQPESSTKYNFAISSLIKDTRNMLSKELRSVADKSLKFHNISANTEQGEKIVQDAFLGHLGTMLDTSASIELFNMDPQIINELSKVLQEDLMGCMNEEVSVKNLADVMHESITDEPIDDGHSSQHYNASRTHDRLSSNYSSASDSNCDNVNQAFSNSTYSMNFKCEKFDSGYHDPYHEQAAITSENSKAPSDSCEQFNLPEFTSNSSVNTNLEYQKFMESLLSENTDPGLLKIEANESTSNSVIPKSKDTYNPPSSKENNDSSREQILRNFDIATNKYETAFNNNTDTPKKSKQAKVSLSKESHKESSKSKHVNIDQSNESNLVLKLASNIKNEVVSPDCKSNNLLESPQKDISDHNNKCNIFLPVSINNSCIISQNKDPSTFSLDHLFNGNVFAQSHFNSLSKDKSNNIPLNTHINKNQASNEFTDKNNKIKTDDIINKKRSKNSKRHKSKCPTSNNPSISVTAVPNNLDIPSNATLISCENPGLQSPLASIENSNKSDNGESTANLKLIQSIESEPEKDGKSDKISLVDISKLLVKNEIQLNDKCSNVDECVSPNKTPTKCQGTQYYDFGKVNASSQVYASLIFSKSKGTQSSKINCKDNFCQTLKCVEINNLNGMNEILETSDKDCQTVEIVNVTLPEKSEKTMVNKEVQVSIESEVNAVNKLQNLKQSDVLNRMKEIDSNIQLLVQEKLDLYKMLDSNSFTNDNNKRYKLKIKSGFISNVPESPQPSKVLDKKSKIKNCISLGSEKPCTLKSGGDTVHSANNKVKSRKNPLEKNKTNDVLSGNKNDLNRLKKPNNHNEAESDKSSYRMRKRVRVGAIKENKTTARKRQGHSKSIIAPIVNSKSSLDVENVDTCHKTVNIIDDSNNVNFAENLPFSNVASEENTVDNCTDLQNDNKNINNKKLQNKIVCKRKLKSISKSTCSASKRPVIKKTPLSALMAELDDSGDDADLDFTNASSMKSESTTNDECVDRDKTPVFNLKKKYNLRKCKVILEPVNVSSDSPTRYNSPDKQIMSQGYSDEDYNICLDEINSVEFENLTDPDIPSMLENIRGDETMTLMDNWDSKLFDNVTLSESVNVFDESLSNEKAALNLDINLLNATTSCVSEKDEEMCQNEDAATKSDNDEDESAYNSNENIYLTDHSDSIIAIECIGDKFLAASLDGNVYYYCASRGILLSKMECSNLAITSLWIKSDVVYTGSLDSYLKCFNFHTGTLLYSGINVGSPIQSMCLEWDIMYIGTRTGFVIQFDVKTNLLIRDGAIKFADQAILALNAIKEGPRKVLLIASRSQDVTVNDAVTGLLLRTFHGPNTTVYSLLFHSGKVFCGTSGCHIQVFDFAAGDLIGLQSGGNGAVCLKIYKGLLFAGCYDGIIYVFKPDAEQPFACIRGPGKMLLAMAIFDNKIIGGCKDKSLSIWNIPDVVMNEISHCT